ncbi:MAG: hemolysin family protein [Defluviitaleaceae bacterium]|nr:hemolysin family protein [Defluviitaleaceae bacterium]
MSIDIVVTVIFLFILLMMGTFFSAAEMAFSALNRARLKSMLDGGNKRAALALKLSDRFDELLSTMLICNNLVAITAATLAAVLFVRLIPEYGAIISTIVVSIVVIVFTDIFPKTIAKEAPEATAIFCSPVALLLMTLLKPINIILSKWKAHLSRIFMSKSKEDEDAERGFRGQALLYMVEEAEQEGAINEEDSLLISNAIEFNDLKAEDILTPRVNIIGISKDSSIDSTAEIFMESGYSRLPVYEESLDNITGLIHIRDFIKCVGHNHQSLDSIITPAVYTVTSAKVTELFKLLQKKKSHMAIVTDEYGGTEGIVTMEDILEQLVGDIWDENDEVVEEFTPVNENDEESNGRSYKVLCTTDIDKMFEFFDMDEESDVSTVSGWIMDQLGRTPEEGDTFTYEKLVVTVTKADGRIADECIIAVVPESSDIDDE